VSGDGPTAIPWRSPAYVPAPSHTDAQRELPMRSVMLLVLVLLLLLLFGSH